MGSRRFASWASLVSAVDWIHVLQTKQTVCCDFVFEDIVMPCCISTSHFEPTTGACTFTVHVGGLGPVRDDEADEAGCTVTLNGIPKPATCVMQLDAVIAQRPLRVMATIRKRKQPSSSIVLMRQATSIHVCGIYPKQWQPPDIRITGNLILRLIDQIAHVSLLRTSTLTDAACFTFEDIDPSDLFSIKLNELRMILTGNSWYEARGYLPRALGPKPTLAACLHKYRRQQALRAKFLASRFCVESFKIYLHKHMVKFRERLNEVEQRVHISSCLSAATSSIARSPTAVTRDSRSNQMYTINLQAIEWLLEQTPYLSSDHFSKGQVLKWIITSRGETKHLAAYHLTWDFCTAFYYYSPDRTTALVDNHIPCDFEQEEAMIKFYDYDSYTEKPIENLRQLRVLKPVGMRMCVRFN